MRKTLSLIWPSCWYSVSLRSRLSRQHGSGEQHIRHGLWPAANGLLSEILSQIGIANDDNFIHGIVGDIAAGTLSEDQASAMVISSLRLEISA